MAYTVSEHGLFRVGVQYHQDLNRRLYPTAEMCWPFDGSWSCDFHCVVCGSRVEGLAWPQEHAIAIFEAALKKHPCLTEFVTTDPYSQVAPTLSTT